MPRSLVVYRGPTCYPGFKGYIRAILVLRSANRKTGNMAQLHILPDRVAPHVAQRTGSDSMVCGRCPLRPSQGGGCYVVTCQGPLSTWRATKGEPVASPEDIRAALQGRTLRLGAYGDPAALPTSLVASLVAAVQGRATGYTHGWRDRPDLKPYAMASVETPADMFEAHGKGWRTFRARAPGAPVLAWEIDCPAPKVTCEACLLCRGASLRARSISIPVHGSRARKALRLM